MYTDFDRTENRFDAHKIPNETEGFREARQRGCHRPSAPHCAPRGFGPDAPRCVPRGFGPEDALGCVPRGFGGARFAAPPFGMGPGFPPHGGMPPFGGHGQGMGPRGPRRPDPAFLNRRVEDADLAELIDMAGRMLRRRPQGGPAQGQALVLSILMGREALTQRELQQMLGIQPGSLSELVSKLEIKGFVTREKAEDRRGNLLRITDAGRAAAAETADIPEDDPFAALTDDQQDQLAAALRALLNQWIAQLDEPPRCPRGEKPVQL